MTKTAIVTDSNSGITRSFAEEMGIFVVPMPFLVNDEHFYEDVNLTQETFYEKLKSGANVSTSQPIVGELIEFWENVLKQYEQILYIPMSAGLSHAYQTAVMLAKEKEFDGKVFVVNNGRISITQKQSVLEAKTLLDGGMPAINVKNYLEETRLDSSIYISIPTLKYLKKGGRITPAAAAVGTILHLRPVLQIQGDKLDKYRMTTVTMRQAKTAMIDGLTADLEGRFSDLRKAGKMVISVAHTQNEAKALEFREELKELFPDVPVLFCDPLSLSVSCHIGPGALACACVRAKM